jgi:hypothetical protein
MHDALTLVPEPLARRTLVDRPVRLRVLAPPFPALGVGSLRVLRILPSVDGWDVTAGYDRYERLG